MADALIENPILNSPFREPTRHWAFGETGIADEIVGGRRVSSYFMPIPASKVRGKQLELETQWTRDRIEENRLINQVRERVAAWRSLRYPGVTPTTRPLLERARRMLANVHGRDPALFAHWQAARPTAG